MKLLAAIACLVGSLSAFGQGYLAFANLGASVNSPFRDNLGVALTDTGNYTVEMLVGASVTTVTDSLGPLFTGTINAGYFNGGSRTVPAADIVGGQTWVVIRAWGNAGGTITSYAQALATPTAVKGVTPPFQVTPQSSAQVPPNPLAGMPYLNGNGRLYNDIIPEPSTWTLGLLGLVALVGCRRYW